ncbi:MAG: hypothetical protein A3H79_04375 [Candidatus Levybacteria bacterium RIFCSPLOWO2_02_FULL_36_8b]|nr:MAG: hypothetical protein A3H79_04375 [Candidatus Levybacteria bacterium RIFCSPLOWO2_02_FULL_36_8b]
MNKTKAAGCVLQNNKGKILLLHRNTPKRVQWETPGGKIEEGEDPTKTAEREVKEELGIVVEIISKLGEHEFLEDGFSIDYVWYKAVVKSGTPKIMEAKFDTLNYFSWEELKKMESQLSANTRNLVNAYFENKLQF